MAFILSQLLLVQLTREAVLGEEVEVAKFERRSGVTLSVKYFSKAGAVAVYISFVVSRRALNMVSFSAAVTPTGPKMDASIVERSQCLMPILSRRCSSMFCFRCIVQLSVEEFGKAVFMACFMAISSSVPKMG